MNALACLTGMALPALLSAALVARGEAQSLASRVSAVGTGTVSFHFTPRPGVCGDGEHFIRTGRHQYYGSWNSHRGLERCSPGPVQVRATVEDGAVDRVQYWVGPLRDRAARDLGAVAAPEAARYLMSLAASGSARASPMSIMPAVLADSATVWPALLAIAKDGDRPRATRREAVQWLSRFAAGAAAGRPNEPFFEDEGGSEEDELKKQALFVASQLPHGDGVPLLIEVARSHSSWRVRSQALFWLGQSGDSRTLAVFESILNRGS